MLQIVVGIVAFLSLVACIIMVALPCVVPRHIRDKSYLVKAKNVCGINTLIWVIISLLTPNNVWSLLFVIFVVGSSYLFTLYFSEQLSK
ncbi:MAG: hypothetical protein NTZ13_00855 [Candidatus Parcubacteria bacterium]|nr:hypothetical protein [Candidatus Parcubacteria bacterium]